MKLQNVVKRVIEASEEISFELEERLDELEERRIDEDYISLITKNKITDMKTLLEYYKGLENNIERLNFDRFVTFVMQDEEKADELLKEILNLTLLNRTGLLKYTKEQENYSKQIVSNFLLKVGRLIEEKEEYPAYNQVNDCKEQIDLVEKYTKYFAPIGIIKDIDNADEYYEYLTLIGLNDKDKTSSLLMSLNFNHTYHENELKNYQEVKNLDKLSLEPELIKEKQEIDEAVEESVELKAEINEKELKEETAKKETKEVKVEEELDILQSIDKKDLKIISKAKKYLDKNKKLIENLTEIEKEDLNDTMNVYELDKDLREEVYRTTENIERLLAYELNSIFSSYDEHDSEEILNLASDAKPVVDYIDKTINKKSSKSK